MNQEKTPKNKYLTLPERLQLYKLKRLNYSNIRIAKELGRDKSTIGRELSRNLPPEMKTEFYNEQAIQAQKQYEERKHNSGKRMRLKSAEIRNYTYLHIKQAHWSPEDVSGRLRRLGYKISHEAIYQWINEEFTELKSCLKVAGKFKRRRRTKPKRVRPVPVQKRSIEEFPKVAKERSEIGHIELDAVVGKQGKSALQVKVDRYSRKMFIDKSNDLKSESYAALLIRRLIVAVPQGLLKTVLMDNGSEHAEFKKLEEELNIETYFCHPMSPHERGTVENRNRAIRVFLPKGTDFDDIPDEYIEWIEDYYNNKPLKVLEFRTPNEVWDEQIKNWNLKKAA